MEGTVSPMPAVGYLMLLLATLFQYCFSLQKFNDLKKNPHKLKFLQAAAAVMPALDSARALTETFCLLMPIVEKHYES